MQFSPFGGNCTMLAPSDAGTPARARTGGLGLRRLALYPTELQTHMVFRALPARKDIVSPATRCCQGVFPIAAARLFRQKALQSRGACGMLILHGWISRKIE